VPDWFAKKIKSKYDFEPRRWNMEGYESWVFLKAGLENAEDFTGVEVQKGLAEVKEIDGVTAKLKFDNKGNVTRPVLMKVIENGEYILIEK
jgi:ABC-type branched-subunit amino acid transport system substrate-binding protein